MQRSNKSENKSLTKQNLGMSQMLAITEQRLER